MVKQRLLFIITVMMIVSVALSGTLCASVKSNAKDDIQVAQKVHEKLVLSEKKKDKKLHTFIPYLEFNAGWENYQKALREFQEESEYEKASYYGVLASVYFEAAREIALAKFFERRALEAEVKYLKKKAKKEMLKSAIASAKLRKKGKSYAGYIIDKRLFEKRSFTLTDRSKNKYLEPIYQVLDLYPKSKLIIKGHTKRKRKAQHKSEMKAKAVKEYFTIEKGIKDDRIETEAMGRTQKVRVGRRKKHLDRVQIIIVGTQ